MWWEYDDFDMVVFFYEILIVCFLENMDCIVIILILWVFNVCFIKIECFRGLGYFSGCIVFVYYV